MRKLAVITGTTNGIGFYTARDLARAGHAVVMLCRNVAAANAVREDIIKQVPQAKLHVVACDLSSMQSVRDAAAAVRSDFSVIDLLVNNGGIVTTSHRMTAEGFELTFATNHLGPFLLTKLLLDRMADDARIVTVASRAHYPGTLDLNSVVNPKARYRAVATYAQSKLANILHTFALARRLAETGITVNCLHPGVVATNLLPRWLQIIKPLLSPVILDAERGAQTTLYLALSEKVAGISGKYFDENQNIQNASDAANNMLLQEALWAASERWTA